VSRSRIAPGRLRDTGPLAWGFSRIAGRVMRTQPPNLFTTLGRHPSLLRGWLFFAGRLMPRGKLPRRDTELVILRVAHLRECAYEWEHHVTIGARAGVGGADLERVKQGPDAAGWSAREAAIVAATDELTRTRDVSDETWARLRAHLDERRLIELVMLVAHYDMLATFIRALRIETDPPR